MFIKAYRGLRIFYTLKTPRTNIRKLRQERTYSVQNHSALFDLYFNGNAELHPLRAEYDLYRIFVLYHSKTSLSTICEHLFALFLKLFRIMRLSY